MKMTNFQAVAANLVAEGDVCDLACAKPATQPETHTQIAPIIQKREPPRLQTSTIW